MASTSASSPFATLIVLSPLGRVLLILNPTYIQPLEKLYTISHVVSLLLTGPTDTFRHVVLFLYGSFALPLRRRSLMVMRITSLRQRGVGEILLIILHMVDRITTCILNSLLLSSL
jgi:hypothetical protein